MEIEQLAIGKNNTGKTPIMINGTVWESADEFSKWFLGAIFIIGGLVLAAYIFA